MSLTVYKSSAGSGKTFTLVSEYLSIVIDNPANFRHILAITFTNKAANEMKTRILSFLSGIAYGSENDDGKMLEVLKAHLQQRLGLKNDQLQSRAETALRNILHGYSNFAVSTIDSFVHRLVRHFTRELELPLNFDVEMDQDKLIKKSIELLLSKVGSDPGLTRTLVSFVSSKMDDEKSWDVERELRKITEIMLRESSVDALETIKEMDAADYLRINSKLSGMISRLEEQIIKIGQQGIQMIDSHAVEPSDFYQGNSSIYAYFNRLAKGDFEKPEPNNYVQRMLETGNWTSGKCNAASASAIEELKPELTGLLDKAVELTGKILPEINLYRLIRQHLYPTAVLSEIEQVMHEFREHDNIVHISEFNKRISAIIGPEPVPFIYERIGEKYRHFLVDEFQDTSVLQWQNLLPLFENSLAANHFNMIVGDGKQAIYRWRNGEVEQFAVLPKIYNRPADPVAEAREKLLEQHFDERFLRQNYRSAKEVVDFNNDFFDFASDQLPDHLKGIYLQVKQEVDQSKSGGHVQVEFFNQQDMSKEEKLQEELQRVLGLVKGFHHDEGFRLNEITVLTRTNDDASNVARHLLENGISVVTSEALRLSASPEVRFLIDNLRHFIEPGDPGVVADMLVFLLQHHNQPLAKLHELLLDAADILAGKPGAKMFEEIIKESFGIDVGWHSIRHFNLYEMMVTLVRRFDLDPSGNHPFIRFFMDTVLVFSATNDENVTDFLEYWDETGHKASIVIPEETDAVRVMTIHKAKGLQFPVVIFPFASGNNKLGRDEVWIAPEIDELPELKMALVKTGQLLQKTRFAALREQEIGKSFLDQLNVLYVAMTRPKERLVVLLRDKHNNKGLWKEGNLFPDVADLFYAYLQSKDLWNNESPVYKFGYDGERRHATKEVATARVSEEKYKKGNWRSEAALHFRAGRTWDPESTDTSRDYGIMIHNILASVKTKDDIEQAVNQAIMEGMLESSLKSKVEAEIHHMISLPDLARFFDPEKKIFAEKEIILEDGDLLRPDRVVIDDRETSVVDYKTGSRREEHKQQVEEYAAAMAGLRYQNIKKYLVYLKADNKNVDVVAW